MGFFVVRMEKKQNKTNQGALEFWKAWKKFPEAFYAAKMPSAENLSPVKLNFLPKTFFLL